MTKAFNSYPLTHGLLADFRDDEFPTLLNCWNNDDLIFFPNCTNFGYVFQGQAVLHCDDSGALFVLNPGMFFGLPGRGSLMARGQDSQGIAITRLGYEGTFTVGGPIEKSGRLKYINGCRDSLLIPPVMLGDPCLNALYFPERIDQTPHTHPSMRVGMVVSGSGECVTPDKVFSLEPGQVFVIPAGSLHSFKTTDQPLIVIAYHPDSDYGPTHENHPMLNRTWIDGAPASQLEEIRTHG